MVWGLERFSVLFSGAVKGFLWFRVLMRKDEGHPDMSCKKNSTENNRPTERRGAWEPIYRFYREREKRRYSHLYRGASLSDIWRRHLLVYRRLDYWPHCTRGECTLTYIQYCRGGDNWEGGRRRGCRAVPLTWDNLFPETNTRTDFVRSYNK